jgi:hypothetical protein
MSDVAAVAAAAAVFAGHAHQQGLASFHARLSNVCATDDSTATASVVSAAAAVIAGRLHTLGP